MDKDRKAICKIMSEMLDNPDENGIYPTGAAYDALEHLMEKERTMAIGWAHADACATLDQGNDPRKIEYPDLLERAQIDLAKGEGHE